MKPRLATLGVIIMVAFSSSQAMAAENAVARAKDASDFFTTSCLRTVGETSAVNAALKSLIDAKAATPLKDVAVLSEPRANAAYLATTPSGARLTLLTGAKRFCAMVVDNADAKSLRGHLKKSIGDLASAMKATVSSNAPTTKKEAGANVTAQTYKLILAGKGTAAPTITVSTADKAVNGKQHLVTFFIGKKPTS